MQQDEVLVGQGGELKKSGGLPKSSCGRLSRIGFYMETLPKRIPSTGYVVAQKPLACWLLIPLMASNMALLGAMLSTAKSRPQIAGK